MQAKERAIIVKGAEYFVPGIYKVRSQADELFVVTTNKRLAGGDLVVLERSGTWNPFNFPAWRVKESETTEYEKTISEK